MTNTKSINIVYNEPSINISGHIFVCDELCDMNFNYTDLNSMSIQNINKKYFIIPYSNGSSIKYNGGEKFGTNNKKYILKNILLYGPPKNFINSTRNLDWCELALIHESQDGETYQVLIVQLKPSNTTASRKTIQYQLFNKLIESLPQITSEEESKLEKVKDIKDWNVDDMLPDSDNRSFYTYNSPENEKYNYVVFEKPVSIPIDLEDKIKEYVPNSKIRNEPNTAPNNPENLFIFGHKMDGIATPSGEEDNKTYEECKPKKKNTKGQEEEEGEEGEGGEEGEEGEEKEKEGKTSKKILKEESKEDKKEETTKGLKWYWILLIVIGVILFLGIIIFVLWYFNIIGDIFDFFKWSFDEIKKFFVWIFNSIKGLFEKKPIYNNFPKLTNVPAEA